MERDTTFISALELARRTGLSDAWLRTEAKAGRIPCVKVGRSIMFPADLAEQSLLERAKVSGDEK